MFFNSVLGEYNQDLPWDRDDRSALACAIGDSLYLRLLVDIDLDDSVDVVAFVEEVSRQQWLMLRAPSGPEGQWEVCVGAARDETCPVVTEYLDFTVRSWDECVADALGTTWATLRDFEWNSDDPNLDLGWMAATPFANESTDLWGILADQELTRAADEIGRFRHPGLPSPVLAGVGVSRRNGYELSRWSPTTLTESMEVDQPTMSYLRRELSRPSEPGPGVPALTPTADGSIEPSESLANAAASLADSASELFARCLVDAPRLELVVAPPEAWLHGPSVSWAAVDPTGERVGLDDLSQAQGRWAKLAIGYVLVSMGHRSNDSGPVVLFLDEPDAALHATAQRNLVAALRSLGGDGAATVVSTHSREFLNDAETRLLHVKRDPNGNTTVHELEDGLREHMEEFGITPADLLQLHRTVIIVEGRHDQFILDRLLGRDLERCGALIVAMRGAKHLPGVIDAQLLLDYTDAHLIIALDNLHQAHVTDVWDRSRAAAANGDLATALEIVNVGYTGKISAELGWLKEFCWGALERDLTGRINIHAMEAGDIIYYLPVQAFVPEVDSWETLVDACHASGAKSFKPWLQRTHGVEVTDELLAQAIDGLDHVPEDFTRLLSECQRLQRFTPMRPQEH